MILSNLCKSFKRPLKTVSKLSLQHFQTKIPQSFLISRPSLSYTLQLPFSKLESKMNLNEEDLLKSLQKSIQRYGADSPKLISIYQQLGTSYDLKKNHGEALPCYQKAVELSIKASGEKDQKVANCYIRLGLCQFYLGNYQEAINNYNHALQIFQEIPGCKEISFGIVDEKIGSAYFYEEKYEEALKFYKKALPIYLNKYVENHPEVFMLYFQIGLTCETLGKYEEVVGIWEKVINIQGFLFENMNSLQMAEPHFKLGVANQKLKRYRQAEEHFQEVLAIYNKIANVDSQSLIDCYKRLAQVQLAQRQYDKAIAAYKKIDEILKNIAKENTIEQADNYGKLAGVYQEKKDFSNALGFLKIQLTILLGIDTESDLGINQLCGKIKEVTDLANAPPPLQKVEEVIPVAEEQLSDKTFKEENLQANVDTLDKAENPEKEVEESKEEEKEEKKDEKKKDRKSALEVALEEIQEGKHKEAMERLKKGIESFNKKSEKKEDLIYFTKLNETLGNLYFGLNKFKEARESFEKAQKNLKKVFGEKSLELAGNYNNVAGTLLAEGKADKAYEIGLKGVQILKGKVGKDDLSLSGPYLNLGKILVELEQYKEALNYITLAYELRKKALGKKHQETVTAQKAHEELLKIIKESQEDEDGELSD